MKPLPKILGLAVAALALIAGGGIVGRALGPKAPVPAPSDPLAAVSQGGKRLAGPLVLAYAQAIRTAADTLHAGGTLKASQDAEEATFKAERMKNFDATVKAQLAAIVPEGDFDPKDAVAREKMVTALYALAHGLDPSGPTAPRPPPPAPPKPPEPVHPFADEEAAQAAPPPQAQAAPDVARFGWLDKPIERAAIASQLPHRTFGAAAPRLVGAAEPEAVYLYKAWQEVLGAYPDYPAQQIGDCTSFGSGHAVDLLQCINIAVNGGDKSQYRETSTEVIYGLGREIGGMLGGGDGCYGVAVAKGLTDVGALPREKVGPYSGQRAKQYGRSGVPADFKALAREHKLGDATLVTTTAEAKGAIANLYPFIVCSNQGFTMTRDADGVCEASGHWAHCMFVAGYRTKGGELQFLVCQSWGSRTPTGPLSDGQPPFSFWVREKVMGRMLAAQDSLAFSKFAGFVPQAVPARWTWSGFAEPAPKLAPKAQPHARTLPTPKPEAFPRQTVPVSFRKAA